jgi:hypothetical protein
VAGRGLTAEGASHEYPSTPTVANTNYFSKLPQELKDDIHDYVMWDMVGEDDEVEIMGLADCTYANAPTSQHSQADSNKTFENAAKFLRTHRKFRATCHTADDVSRAWERYAELQDAVASSLHKCSFRLVFAKIARDMLCALTPFYIDEYLRNSAPNYLPVGILLRSIVIPNQRAGISHEERIKWSPHAMEGLPEGLVDDHEFLDEMYDLMVRPEGTRIFRPT